MAKSAYQLMKEGKDWRDVGNPKLKQQLRQLQQQNYQAQLRQVNANFQAGLAQGLTPGQAATSWVLPTPNQQYTVKDGDNLSTIASATGSSPDAILNANPDMKAPETGMILKTPAQSSQYFQSEKGLTPQPATPLPGSEAFRIQQQNKGGLGLPSNAALGATSPNVQGSNYFQSEKFGAPIQKTPAPRTSDFANSPLMKGLNWLRNVTTPNWNPNAFATPAELKYGAASQNPTAFGAQPTTTPRTTTSTTPALPGGRGQPSLIIRALHGYNPTPAEINQLVQQGFIKKTSPQAFGGLGGNYSYSSVNKRLGRGGGGGGQSIAMPSQPRYNPDDNLPAFSTGGGFRGLVYWRM